MRGCVLKYFILLLSGTLQLLATTSRADTDNLVTLEKLRSIVYWQGNLQLNDSTQMNLDFRSKSDLGALSLQIQNGTEVILINEIVVVGDSMFFRMPVFDSEFRLKVKGDTLSGYWINYNRKEKNKLKYTAVAKSAAPTKSIACSSTYLLDGRWEITFSPGSKTESKSLGLFDFEKQKNTFLTETGDYRYLYQVRGCNSFELSCFDGSHAFYFKGKLVGDTALVGDFYSGAHWHEKFVGAKSETFELRNPDSLTFLKPGFEQVDFSFKDLNGNQVSLHDARFQNKVVIVQIMGSWCPNCMDETKYFASLFPSYRRRGLEIVGVCFEKTTDFALAVEKVNRVKEKFHAGYTFVIADRMASVESASLAFPMLNAVMSFPTTIYIDKKGKVRKIHTGFNGPATGNYFMKFTDDTETLLEKLLSE